MIDIYIYYIQSLLDLEGERGALHYHVVQLLHRCRRTIFEYVRSIVTQSRKSEHIVLIVFWISKTIDLLHSSTQAKPEIVIQRFVFMGPQPEAQIWLQNSSSNYL